MSKYTTGEVAKRCGVTVRTVQYYDTRGILVPAELSEGGRRLYSEDDLKRMRVICFLRDLGFSIDAIGKLLSDDDPAAVIDLPIEQQAQTLREEIGERQERLSKLEALRRELRDVERFIGCPIPFDTDVFLHSLERLMEVAYSNDKQIRNYVVDIVSTYHPDNPPVMVVKDAKYVALV